MFCAEGIIDLCDLGCLFIDEHGDICWRNIIGPDNLGPAFVQKVGFYITDIAGAPSHYVLGYIE